MGIKKLLEVVFENKKTIADCAVPIKWKDMTNKIVLVDAFNIIYSSIGVGGEKFNLTDSSGRVTKHINIIVKKIAKLMQYNIGQIWIFDGESHSLKGKEQARRREVRKFTVTDEQVEEVKHLLKLCGISYVEAPAGVEAEILAAKYTNIKDNSGNRKYAAVMSNDTDVIICGGNLLISRKSHKEKVPKDVIGYIINPVLLCRNLNITMAQLLDIGIALGSDFNTKVKGVGPKTVVKRVKDGSIDWNEESIVAKAHIKNMIDGKMEDVNVVSEDGDREMLEEFLRERDFNMERMSKTINTIFE
jgi:flap endonuclease-1